MKKTYTFVTLKGKNSFIATVPELPGVVAQAESAEGLFPRVKEAINAYVSTLDKEKLDVPDDIELLGVNQVDVNYE